MTIHFPYLVLIANSNLKLICFGSYLFFFLSVGLDHTEVLKQGDLTTIWWFILS